MSAIKTTALLALGSSALAQTTSHPDLANFLVQDPSFNNIVRANASITLIYNATEALFHEGAVYDASTDTLFASSNRLALPNNQTDESTSNQTIKLSAIKGVTGTDSSLITIDSLSTSTINLPNGGVAHLGTDGGLLWTAQGSKTTAAGIFSIPDPINAPDQAFPVVTEFFGRPFNGPNDVVVHPTDNGTIWFTDVDFAFSQGLRNAPQLPNHVYRYDPATNATRAVVDGVAKPNGLAFNPEGTVLYVTDTEADTVTDPTGAASIYAFDVLADSPGQFLVNKRLFAFAPVGIPDGIKIDAAGNVWAGTGAGVVVWNVEGTLLGEIAVEGGVANFGFGSTEQTMFLLNEKLLWRVQLG